MRIHRPAAISLAAAITLLVAGGALARSNAVAKAPADLKPFLLRPTEQASHDFTRTPSFSWSPVRGALRYEFQLAKSATFSESSIFWKTGKVNGPAVAIPLALPWMTGNPYAAYARVRAVTVDGVGEWSAPYGFNLRWSTVPQQLPGYPGLSRWTPVEGATGYEVWFTKIGPNWSKRVSTRTNAVDHREAYAFHDTPEWTSEVRWRVRAVRRDASIVHLNGLPAVSYGPWSPVYSSVNPPTGGPLVPTAAVTNGATSKRGAPRLHELTPAFAFSGQLALNATPTGAPYGLYRVYVSTDSDCVNIIYKGAVVGSPAYAPRTSGPLLLPVDPEKELPAAYSKVLDDGTEGNTFMAGLGKVITTEQADPAGDENVEEEPETPETPADGQAPAAGTPTAPAASAPAPAATAVVRRAVDLPESGWPEGRFYWTVVPVVVTIRLVNDKPIVEYHEPVAAQDQCQAGNVVAFGKDSSPVIAASGTPFASGLSPDGRLVAAKGQRSKFYGHPLVAWEPVQGAAGYEVQWSHSKEEWKALGSIETEGTAAVLPLEPGDYWYRVRARNPYLPGVVKRMAWSSPLGVKVVKPTFKVEGGAPVRPTKAKRAA